MHLPRRVFLKQCLAVTGASIVSSRTLAEAQQAVAGEKSSDLLAHTWCG